MELVEIFKKIDDENEKIEKLNQKIKESTQKIKELNKQLKLYGTEDYDWISVREGAKLIDVTIQAIYKMIKDNKLKKKEFGSRIFIKKSELISNESI